MDRDYRYFTIIVIMATMGLVVGFLSGILISDGSSTAREWVGALSGWVAGAAAIFSAFFILYSAKAQIEASRAISANEIANHKTIASGIEQTEIDRFLEDIKFINRKALEYRESYEEYINTLDVGINNTGRPIPISREDLVAGDYRPPFKGLSNFQFLPVAIQIQMQNCNEKAETVLNVSQPLRENNYPPVECLPHIREMSILAVTVFNDLLEILGHEKRRLQDRRENLRQS